MVQEASPGIFCSIFWPQQHRSKLFLRGISIAASGVPVMADTTADLVPFEALLESTNEGLYGIDLEGRCTFLNRAGARMLGFTRYEVLGRNMHRLIHHSREDGSPYPEEECPIYRVASAAAKRCGWRTKCCGARTAHRFPAEYSGVADRADRGVLRGAVVTFVDITARRQQERRMLVQHDVSRVMAEAESLQEALPRILQAIGENLGWQAGVLWSVNRRRAVLRAQAVWHANPVSRRFRGRHPRNDPAARRRACRAASGWKASRCGSRISRGPECLGASASRR